MNGGAVARAPAPLGILTANRVRGIISSVRDSPCYRGNAALPSDHHDPQYFPCIVKPMARRLTGPPAPVSPTHQLPSEAEIGKLREEEWARFEANQERWAGERQRWVEEQQKRIDDLVLHSLIKRLWPILSSVAVVAILSGGFMWWRLDHLAKELTEKSEQTAALNDSLRLMLAQSRDSLRLTLNYSQAQLDLQNRLYGDALGAYRDGFLTTLLQNADLKGRVAGQIALAEQSIQRADRAATRLDSTRMNILSVNDSLALRLDTVLNWVRTRPDSLSPEQAASARGELPLAPG
jgi:hypothetical protein